MLLRRTKATRIDGQPVVDLPERRVVLQRIAFSPPERVYYDDLQKESASQLRVRLRTLDCEAACFGLSPAVRHGMHEALPMQASQRLRSRFLLGAQCVCLSTGVAALNA